MNRGKRVVVFSGAGMSAESGISTFRDSGGLWEKYDIEEVATVNAWRINKKVVQEFYNERRKQIISSQPNPAHMAVSALEKQFEVRVITQNIDDLHERAGSSKVVHLHGNIRLAKSSGPSQESAYYPIEGWELKLTDLCPDGYPLRPHVVWFGEEVPLLNEASRLIKECDVLIVIGTSLNVYPAAGLIHLASPSAKKFIIDPHVNEMTVPDDFEQIAEKASEGIRMITERLQLKR